MARGWVPPPRWPGASWLEARWLKEVARPIPLPPARGRLAKDVAREPRGQQKRPREGVLCYEDFHGWWGGEEGVSYTLIGG